MARIALQLPLRRFLTIVGPGRIGKTSVALAVAQNLVSAYGDGVWLIDLVPIAQASLVPTALAAAIGFEIRAEDPLPGLIAFLKDKHMLLVFDNCEHVAEAAAGLAVAGSEKAQQVYMSGHQPGTAAGARRVPALLIAIGEAGLVDPSQRR